MISKRKVEKVTCIDHPARRRVIDWASQWTADEQILSIPILPHLPSLKWRGRSHFLSKILFFCNSNCGFFPMRFLQKDYRDSRKRIEWESRRGHAAWETKTSLKERRRRRRGRRRKRVFLFFVFFFVLFYFILFYFLFYFILLLLFYFI